MFEIIVVVALMVIGYIFGSHAEATHYRSILKREGVLVHLPAIPFYHPDPLRRVETSAFVIGSCVISNDYFKRILAMFYSFVGANVVCYESLIDRARREAVLRMKERATAFDEIVNVRIETSSINGLEAGARAATSIEVIAYGTAMKYEMPRSSIEGSRISL